MQFSKEFESAFDTPLGQKQVNYCKEANAAFKWQGKNSPSTLRNNKNTDSPFNVWTLVPATILSQISEKITRN